METIDICFSISDSSGKYCKYLGVALLSLIENTDAKIRFHILHDNTLTEQNKARLLNAAKRKELEAEFYYIDTARFSNISKGLGILTVGTLFRLMIPELLPRNVNKVIYLDADIIVNIDIAELWRIPLEDKWIAGCVNKGLSVPPYPCRKGFVEENKYFNAGVLILDLKQIRNNMDLMKESIAYLEKNPGSTFFDNDALNVVLADHVKYLPEKYNLFTVLLRKEKSAARQGIFHFAGDYVHTTEPVWLDRLFYEIWSRSSWWSSEDILQFQMSRENVLNQRNLANKALARAVIMKREICIWGANSVLKKTLLEEFGCLDMISFFVDSNKTLSGNLIDNKNVFSPDVIWSVENRYFVIVLSKKYFDEIGTELRKHDYVVNEDYIDGALLFPYEAGGAFPGL